MIDIARLVASFGEAQEGAKGLSLPKKLGTLPNDDFFQVIDSNHSSHISHVSHDQTRHLEFEIDIDPENAFFEPADHARSELLCKTVGIVGIVGSPNENNAKPFPLENDLVGRVGRDREPAGDLDLVSFDPRPSPPPPSPDWWADELLAEPAPQDTEASPAAGIPASLPISPAQVRAGIEREVRDLASHGRTGPAAYRDAVAITRAKIRNSPVLVESQTGASHCLVCSGAEDPDRPFIPVLSGAPGRPHWIHMGCHAEHSRRLTVMVDAIMAAAGFGDERQRGAA